MKPNAATPVSSATNFDPLGATNSDPPYRAATPPFASGLETPQPADDCSEAYSPGDFVLEAVA